MPFAIQIKAKRAAALQHPPVVLKGLAARLRALKEKKAAVGWLAGPLPHLHLIMTAQDLPNPKLEAATLPLLSSLTPLPPQVPMQPHVTSHEPKLLTHHPIATVGLHLSFTPTQVMKTAAA